MSKFYVVLRGRKRGIYYSWKDCSEQVTGYKGAKFKSFKTAAEVNQYLDDNRVAYIDRI